MCNIQNKTMDTPPEILPAETTTARDALFVTEEVTLKLFWLFNNSWLFVAASLAVKVIAWPLGTSFMIEIE